MSAEPEKPEDLTDKQAAFVAEYLIDLNATQAAIRAGYSANTAEAQGSRLLSNVKVAEAVRSALDARARRTEITADRVLEQFWAIATADPNELIQFRRGACPDCWGGGSPNEELEGQAHGGALKRMRKPVVAVADEEPNHECSKCGGEGVGRVWAADTRKLKGPARRLYAGVKVTKEGLEVKMHDQMNALIQVGRHLGMFTDKTEIRHSGRVDSVTTVELVGPDDQG